LKKGLVLLLIALVAGASVLIYNPQAAKADSPFVTQWTNTYGEPANQTAYSVAQTSDGGYVIASSKSNLLLLIKTDALGKQLWNASYSLREGIDYFSKFSVIQTIDNGYALAGSYVSGLNPMVGLLIKTDASGNQLWNYSSGGYSKICSVLQTDDGGLVWGGYNFYRFPGNAGNALWLNKTDLSGNQIWGRIYEEAAVYSIVQTSDRGYALTTFQNAGVGTHVGGGLLKTDSEGNQIFWRGSAVQFGTSLIQTSDGGYALVGRDSSNGNYSIKYDSAAKYQWNQTLGSAVSSMIQTDDGGYLLAGGNGLVKTDSSGNTQWSQQFTNVSLACMAKTIDGGYAVAGTYTIGGNSSSWLTKITLNPIPTPTPTSQPPSPTPTAVPTSTSSQSPAPSTTPSPTSSPTPSPQNTLTPSPAPSATPNIPEVPFATVMLLMGIALAIGATVIVLRENNKQK
jgi:hypothetical protein